MRQVIDFILRAYQVILSPFLGSNCRFYPSCSQYSRDCFKKFSITKALWYSCRRICKCHPYHPGGFDPVP